MKLEILFQFVVPLMFLAIWALTSLLNRDTQPLPQRPTRPGRGLVPAQRRGKGRGRVAARFRRGSEQAPRQVLIERPPERPRTMRRLGRPENVDPRRASTTPTSTSWTTKSSSSTRSPIAGSCRRRWASRPPPGEAGRGPPAVAIAEVVARPPPPGPGGAIAPRTRNPSGALGSGGPVDVAEPRPSARSYAAVVEADAPFRLHDQRGAARDLGLERSSAGPASWLMK